MDFDDRFSKTEFRENLSMIGLDLSDDDFTALLERSTSKSRTGHEFGFKPRSFAIGLVRPGEDRFYVGFDARELGSGPDPAYPDGLEESSMWFRLAHDEQRLLFRLYCGYTVPEPWPFRGHILLRDVVPGQIEARALWREADGEGDGTVDVCLTLTVCRPPYVTVCLTLDDASDIGLPKKKKKKRGKRATFDRTGTETDVDAVVADSKTAEADAGPLTPFGSRDDVIKPTIWLTYRFIYSLTPRHYKLFWQCMVRLRSFGLNPDFSRPSGPALPKVPLHPVHRWCMAQLVQLSFRLRYLAEVVLSNRLVLLTEFGFLIEALSRLSSDTDRERFLDALCLRGRPRGLPIETIITAILAAPLPPALDLGTHYMLIRRCLVTSLQVQVLPPHLETTNSVLQHFHRYQDRFLRVQFVADDGPLEFSQEVLQVDEILNENDGPLARIRRALKFGLSVAGRGYTFLAYGESQIKEKGCWMIAEDPPHFTRTKILEWMGDLSGEKVIAKHAARQGLALSTTRAAGIEIVPRLEDDIHDMGNRFNFTDGAGICSLSVAARCASILGITRGSSAHPSAVQVRLPGTKGVLRVAVPAGTPVADNEVVLRPSMIKFPSAQLVMGLPNGTLRVLKVSKYAPAYLSRQAVMLLEALGVPTAIFVDVFRNELRRVEALDDGAALGHWDHAMTFPVSEAVNAGFGEDPLVEKINHLVKYRLLSDLKWKARVEIREGAYLMGVPDDTGTLDEGQIFCQVVDDRTGKREVVVKKCVVYRNPCLHPGDVRCVNAVDAPALRALENVVVFSTKGRRDLPNMLAGGDLDGDHYTIIWDERFLFPWNYSAADYTAPPPPPRVNRQITEVDTKNFFLQYLKDDLLGVVDTAHLAVADMSDPRSSESLHLVDLHNVAVDFFKTGVAAERSQLRPSIQEWPDFMGKDPAVAQAVKVAADIKTYRSPKALGQMFRLIDPEPSLELAARSTAYEPFCNMVISDPYVQKAHVMKAEYEYDLMGLMRAYEVMSEAECVSGLLIKPHKRQARRRRDFNRESAVREGYEWIINTYVQQASDFVKNNRHVSSSLTDKEAWAVACYKAAYADIGERTPFTAAADSEDFEDDTQDLDDNAFLAEAGNPALLSFGWVFREDLMQAAAKRRQM